MRNRRIQPEFRSATSIGRSPLRPSWRAIAERGADAVGYAYRNGGDVHVHKQRSGASKLLDRVEIPQHASKVLVHVRDYTKGHPMIEANNHPVRHGAVVGVHNGIILNDEEIFADHGFERAAPRMTVDSEAIFALAELTESRAKALEELRGSMAAAWIDERRHGLVYCARGVGRPLWVGEKQARDVLRLHRPRARSRRALHAALRSPPLDRRGNAARPE